MILILLALLVAALIGWAVIVFNRLIRARNQVRTALSDIDVQLLRRHDLVPRLVSATQAYATHEAQLFEAVTAARSQAMSAEGTKERDRSESTLAANLSRLVLLAEDYPELKADDNFRQLVDELVEVEDHLQHARRYYNGSVRDYNNRVEQFPDLLVANAFGFETSAFFSADIEAKAVPRVGF